MNRTMLLVSTLGAVLLLSAAPVPAETLNLTLDEARSLALENSEQTAMAAQAVQAASAAAFAARTDALPRLDVGGTFTRNLKKPAFFIPDDMADAFGGQTSLEWGGDGELQAAATLSLDLWTAGRLSAASAAADAQLAATGWQDALVRDAMVFSTDRAYADALLADQKVAIAAAALKTAREALRVADADYEQGTTSRFDVMRARVEVTNREAPLVQAANAAQLARLNLSRICGLAAGDSLVLADTLAAAPSPTAEDKLLTAMRDHSPELKALQATVRARESSLALARAGNRPVVTLQGQYAVQGQWDDDFLPGRNETATSASVALGISIPVFDGFATRARTAGAEAELRRAELDLQRAVRDRVLAVRQARINLINAETALAGRRAGVDLAAEAYRLAQVRLNNGLATPLERLDAELALQSARDQLAEALHSCSIARSTLTLAVGTHVSSLEKTPEVSR